MLGKPIVTLWLAERAIHSLVMYSLAMNLQDYEMERQLTTDKKTPLMIASKLQFAYTSGETILFLVFTIMGDKFRGHLSWIYLWRGVALAFLLLTWQMVRHNLVVEIFLAIFTGACLGVGNAFVYAIGEEVRPDSVTNIVLHQGWPTF